MTEPVIAEEPSAEETPHDSADTVLDNPPSDTAAAEHSPVPACQSITWDAGAELAGSDVGRCLSDALVASETFREDVITDTLHGVFDIVYGPHPGIAGSGEAAGGSFEMVVIEDRIWLNSTGQWVEGDITSNDPESQYVGTVGEVYRIAAMPDVVIDMLSTGERWTVGQEPDSLQLPNGDEVDVWAVESAEPFFFAEISVDEMTLWFGLDATPYGASTRSSMAGISASSEQIFYDHGVELTIEPPG